MHVVRVILSRLLACCGFVLRQRPRNSFFSFWLECGIKTTGYFALAWDGRSLSDSPNTAQYNVLDTASRSLSSLSRARLMALTYFRVKSVSDMISTYDCAKETKKNGCRLKTDKK